MLYRIAKSPYVIVLVIIAGLAARIFLIIRSGNHAEGMLGGGSDAPAYILLGDAISKGHGMTYAGQPTAQRAPLYPLLLAALQLLFGAHSLLVMRSVQFLLAVLTAWTCSKTAVLLRGESTKWLAFAVTICAPTLLFFTTQIMTEAFTAFFVSLFLYFLVQASASDNEKPLIGMGVCSGILLLLRFNTLFVPAIAALTALRFPLTLGSRYQPPCFPSSFRSYSSLPGSSGTL